MGITSSEPIHKRVREDFSAEIVHKLRPKDSGTSQNKMRESVPGPDQEGPWEVY